MSKKRIKKIDLALIIGMIITLLFCSVKGFAQELDGMSGKVVRLHILANSDSDEDQALKIKVRDEIIKKSGEMFEESSSRKQTEQIIINNIDDIKKTAQQVVYDNGYDYKVNCNLENIYFTERVYDNITMPAGYYDALRITIGEAKGHNWWCVLYPQLCIAPSIDKKSLEQYKKNFESDNSKIEEKVQMNIDKDELDYFNEKEKDILEKPKKYKVKFKCVEWYKKFKNWLFD